MSIPTRATAKRPPMTPPAIGPESLLVALEVAFAELELMVVTPVDVKEPVRLGRDGAGGALCFMSLAVKK